MLRIIFQAVRDPISKKYLSSVKLEEEIAKNELYKKELISMKNKIMNLKDENEKLLEEINRIRENGVRKFCTR
jgi:cell shape-determining protein MreC